MNKFLYRTIGNLNLRIDYFKSRSEPYTEGAQPNAGGCATLLRRPRRRNVTKQHSEIFETTFMARKKVWGARGERGRATVGQRRARQSHGVPRPPPAFQRASLRTQPRLDSSCARLRAPSLRSAPPARELLNNAYDTNITSIHRYYYTDCFYPFNNILFFNLMP